MKFNWTCVRYVEARLNEEREPGPTPDKRWSAETVNAWAEVEQAEEELNMENQKQNPGCGGPATVIVYRGAKRRLFLCGECPYEGSGRKIPYATAVEGVTPPPGVHTGPARSCGDEIGGE